MYITLSQPYTADLVNNNILKMVNLKHVTIYTQQLQPFPKYPCIHLSHHTSIYTLNNHGDITQPCQIQHYRKPLTHLDTFPTTYPEWPHRQCVGLAYPRTRVRVAAASLAICSPHLHRAIRGPQEVLIIKDYGGSVTSQLDPPSLTALSIAGCGRLQLGVPIELLQ